MISLEHLADNSVSDRNFQKLMSLVIDTGGQTISVRFGFGTWTWPGGSTDSNVLSGVVHGLGSVVPRIYISPSTSGRGLGWEATPAADTFSTRARADSVLAGGTQLSFYWLAIG